MTLDDLIETLVALRAECPAAGTAFVHCAVDLEEPLYAYGEVQLGFEFARKRTKKKTAKPARVH